MASVKAVSTTMLDYYTQQLLKNITSNLEFEKLKAQLAIIEEAYVTQLDVERLNAAKADIRLANIDVANINTANIDAAIVKTLEAQLATINHLKTVFAEVEQLNAQKAIIENLQANKADITLANIDVANIDTAVMDLALAKVLAAGEATIGHLEANYAKIDMANVNNAWVENGVIKDASIANEKVISVSANKLTAGTIDASKITVTNLNADNITVGTINGQRIGKESISLDKLSEEVPTKEYLDSVQESLQEQIDGAIQTYTGDVIPTLNNYPASSWTETTDKDTHIGDVYYVVNNESEADGHCYRFTKNSVGYYEWVLIKDSDITKALQELITVQGDISGLKTFETQTSSWITNTDEEVSNLKIRASSLETNLGNKVDSTTFNEIKHTVDENSSTITTLSQTVENNYNTLLDEITTILRIDSSRGTVFKNNQVSTVLRVTVYRGSEVINDIVKLKAIMGINTYLQWKWQRLDEDDYGVIPASDSRIQDSGFSFVLSPDDVETKVTFKCELITD